MLAGDVLVQRFAGAQSRDEPLVMLYRTGCRRLCHHGGWIRPIGQVTAAVTGSWQVCDSSRELTIERGVALRVVPGMEVI